MVPLPILANVESASQLTMLLSRPLAPTAIAAGMAIAFGFGAAHALSPGHGKTLVVAYLVGSRGTPKAAFWLGLTTMVTHTLAVVFILRMTILLASYYIDIDRIYPILGAASGLAICLVGLRLLARRLRNGHHHYPAHHHDDPPRADWLSIWPLVFRVGWCPVHRPWSCG